MAKDIQKQSKRLAIRLPTYRFNAHKGFATSNFADYELCSPYVCCGWMDIHTDDPPCEPVWTIRVHSHHSQAVFIVKDKRYKIIELVDNETITFNSMSRHGVIPRSLALEIVERNSCNFVRYKDWVKQINGRAMKPKLVFNFIKDGLDRTSIQY